jgi:hypothetical protein
MHLEVRAAQPGPCPICGMALEPMARGSAASPRPGMGGMIDTAAVDNIRKHKILDFVRMGTLDEKRAIAARPVGGDARPGGAYDDQIAALAADEPGTFTRHSRRGQRGHPAAPRIPSCAGIDQPRGSASGSSPAPRAVPMPRRPDQVGPRTKT